MADEPKPGPSDAERYLSAEENQQFRKWIETHDASTCPLCHSDVAILDSGITATVLYNRVLHEATDDTHYKGDLIPFAPTPVVQTTCTNCGFIMTFSAIKVGILA